MSGDPVSDPRFVDFDEQWAGEAVRAEPVRVRLFGRTWELPAEAPAAVMLQVGEWARAGRSGDDLITAEVLRLATDLVPGDVLDAWKAKGITLEQLGNVLEFLFQTYLGTPTGTLIVPVSGAEGATAADPPS